MVPTQEQQMTTHMELVQILEELREVLVNFDNDMIDRRYMDIAAPAERLHEGIEKVEELPNVER
jgi:hypothetical protein